MTWSFGGNASGTSRPMNRCWCQNRQATRPTGGSTASLFLELEPPSNAMD